MASRKREEKILALLEVFDVARHALDIVLSIWCSTHCSIVRTKVGQVRSESMQCRKQYDHERVGSTKAMIHGTLHDVELFMMTILSFVSTGVRKRERGTYVEKGMCRDRWKDRRTTSLWFIYTPSLPLR